MIVAKTVRKLSCDHENAPPIEYLSNPSPVNMGDWWFDVANTEHFWIRRRFEVMRKLVGSALHGGTRVAEIGCGNGMLQRDIEDHYGIPVSGFELNELALKKNVSRRSPLYCYDIHRRDSRFAAYFNLIFLFDVLEHIEDEGEFLQSVRFHLSDSGLLVINVPAHQFFYSNYDRAAGHVRRYSREQLKQISERNGLKIRALTYWGLPMVPLLLARKALPLSKHDGSSGFDPGGQLVNAVLGFLTSMERIPQTLLGTSVMAIAENGTGA